MNSTVRSYETQNWVLTVHQVGESSVAGQSAHSKKDPLQQIFQKQEKRHEKKDDFEVIGAKCRFRNIDGC